MRWQREQNQNARRTGGFNAFRYDWHLRLVFHLASEKELAQWLAPFLFGAKVNGVIIEQSGTDHGFNKSIKSTKVIKGARFAIVLSERSSL
jgi:hypothetical protein